MKPIALIGAIAMIAASSAQANVRSTNVLKHNYQVSSYKVAWYQETRLGKWSLRPGFDRCAEIRWAKPRGSCYKHRETLRVHEARAAKIRHILWPPPPPRPVASTPSVDSCLAKLIDLEGSGGDPHAWNEGGSGAYGIPQALPGSKMASAGPDWADNPATQIRWMIGYVNARYGGSCGALSAWYRQGGWY